MTDRTPLSRMHGAVDAAVLARHLEWFSTVPRDTGGEGEDRAAAYIAAELEAAGLPVIIHEFDAFLSYPREASFRTLTPSAVDFRCVTKTLRDARAVVLSKWLGESLERTGQTGRCGSQT